MNNISLYLLAAQQNGTLEFDADNALYTYQHDTYFEIFVVSLLDDGLTVGIEDKAGAVLYGKEVKVLSDIVDTLQIYVGKLWNNAESKSESRNEAAQEAVDNLLDEAQRAHNIENLTRVRERYIKVTAMLEVCECQAEFSNEMGRIDKMITDKVNAVSQPASKPDDALVIAEHGAYNIILHNSQYCIRRGTHRLEIVKDTKQLAIRLKAHGVNSPDLVRQVEEWERNTQVFPKQEDDSQHIMKCGDDEKINVEKLRKHYDLVKLELATRDDEYDIACDIVSMLCEDYKEVDLRQPLDTYLDIK